MQSRACRRISGLDFRRSCLIRNAYIALCLVVAFADTALCASIENTPDGHVIFEALGERMLFRDSDFRDRLSFKDDLRNTPGECLDSLFPEVSDDEKSRASFLVHLGNGRLELNRLVWRRG